MHPSSVGPLRGIDGFWRSERTGAPQVEQVLPTGRAQVVIDLGSGVALLVGPRTLRAVVDGSQRAIGFSLSGSGLARIVGGDVRCFVDEAVDLRDLHCDAQRVLDSEGNSGAALRALAGQLVGRFEIDERIAVAERLLRSGASMTTVASRLGFDRRTFVPSFRRAVGVPPKEYQTLGRLHRTTRVLRSGSSDSLSWIAAGMGYADQAHMTRDFRRFTGLTPKQLQRLPPGPPNHLPVTATPA